MDEGGSIPIEQSADEVLQLPGDVLNVLPEAAAQSVRSWWETLPPAERHELVLSWMIQADTCRYAREAQSWFELPVLVGARFLPRENDSNDDGSEWNQDLYEYLINHPELALVQHGIVHHICTSEPSVRRALKQGLIAADFECSAGHEACPVRQLLAHRPGSDVKLFVLSPAELVQFGGTRKR
ncbi:hypothetical protein [Piscinibacter terrae]|uniref:Uncharacterized protein n=1 Tax=Piscinibacter terrae TaxID=2496871 RepID=A0A3N7HSD6_9BURK|nr:hypothetical protein [Albitalea terrae]RQP25208.1 hypothetical protein DZC73_10230 [Albitalea terrae]